MSDPNGYPPRPNPLPRINDVPPPLPLTRGPTPSSNFPPPYRKASSYPISHGLAQYKSSGYTETPSHAYQHESHSLWKAGAGSMPPSDYTADYVPKTGRPNAGTTTPLVLPNYLLSSAAIPERRFPTSHEYPIHARDARKNHDLATPPNYPTYYGQEPPTGSDPLQSASTQTQAPHVPAFGRDPSTTPPDDSDQSNSVTGADTISPWGVTKAGKSRKRLEQACTNCRKKKTKCEPRSSSSKCSPCEKSGSECFFDTAPRSRSLRSYPVADSSGYSSLARNTPTMFPLVHRKSSSSSRPDGQSSLASLASSRSSMDIGNILSPSSHTDSVYRNSPDSNPSKRRRHSLDLSTGKDLETADERTREPPDDSRMQLSKKYEEANVPSWDSDPFEKDQDMTEHYLDHYFTNINMTSFCMFPRDKFMRWVRRDRKKSQAEKMLIYAMLAHGSVFSSNDQDARKADGQRFASFARESMARSDGSITLPTVQTRLVLSLLDYSLGNGLRAWDYCGAATRAACGLKLNVERGVQDVPENTRLDFGFARETLIECRRRTFWSAYVMDRYNGFCSGHLCMLQNANCLLRLPCDEAAYARGRIPETPFFHSTMVDRKLSLDADRSGLGMMAYFVEVSTIWGDILAQAHRSAYQPEDEHGEPAEQFYQQQMTRLTKWSSGLASHLFPSQDNIDKAFHGGSIGVFVSLWLLYHCAAIKLCRHARFQYMSMKQINRNIIKARYHARAILDMMPSLSKVNRENQMPEHAFTVSTPLTGYGILTAVDVLTATGSLFDAPGLLELLDSGMEVVGEMAQYWASANRQMRTIGVRIENMKKAMDEHGSGTGKTAFFAMEAIERSFGLEHDLVYDLPLTQRLRAIGFPGLSDDASELIEIRSERMTTSRRGSLAANGLG